MLGAMVEMVIIFHIIPTPGRQYGSLAIKHLNAFVRYRLF